MIIYIINKHHIYHSMYMHAFEKLIEFYHFQLKCLFHNYGNLHWQLFWKK